MCGECCGILPEERFRLEDRKTCQVTEWTCFKIKTIGVLMLKLVQYDMEEVVLCALLRRVGEESIINKLLFHTYFVSHCVCDLDLSHLHKYKLYINIIAIYHLLAQKLFY